MDNILYRYGFELDKDLFQRIFSKYMLLILQVGQHSTILNWSVPLRLG